MIVCLTALLVQQASAQMAINDESIRYQQERMVYKQWDRNKFTPTSGFLGLNPYYWLTWGLMPGYKNMDLRPLAPTGPQTQRLGLVSALGNLENSYRKEADTLRNTASSEMANQLGVLSPADPLWSIYYAKELEPVINFSEASALGALPGAVRERVVAEGFYNWFAREMQMLAERINGAQTANMDRGARIIAYHRLLLEYRTLAATWANRTANAGTTMRLTSGQQQVRNNQVTVERWSPKSDVEIAREVLKSRKY
jgi:hypothetical protein